MYPHQDSRPQAVNVRGKAGVNVTETGRGVRWPNGASGEMWRRYVDK